MYFCGVFWGAYMGLSNPSSEALFADSIETGKRNTLYNMKWIVQIVCYCVGYVLSLVLFLKIGDNWSNGLLQVVMYVGLGVHPLSMLILTSLRDEDTLKARERIVTVNSKETTPTDDEQRIKEAKVQSSSLVKADWVPYFVVIGDFLLALGSGMTLRYIPLFFINEYGVSPSLLMGVYIIISISTAGAVIVVKNIAERFIGRVAAMIAARVTGTTLLLYLALATGPAAGLIPMLAVFVVRNALMNSTLGTSRGVIMDCCNAASRAKWSAMESFSSFTWAGSATLGGYLSDLHGYRYSFLITCCFHYAAVLALIPAYLGTKTLESVVMAIAAKKMKAEVQ
jgi:MFS family permease